MKASLRLVSLVASFVALLGAACGGSVDAPSPSPAPAGGGAASAGDSPSTTPVTPGAPTVLAPASACAQATPVKFSGGVVHDIAVDATHVWALLIGPGREDWRVARAPKCGGAEELVGAETKAAASDGASTHPRFAVVDGKAMVVAVNDDYTVVRLTSSTGGVTTNVHTTLWGPNYAPAVARGGGATTALYWAMRDAVHRVTTKPGSDVTVAEQVFSTSDLKVRIDDMAVDGDQVYGLVGGGVFRVDLPSGTKTQVNELLMEDSRRFVRALGGDVFVVGRDVARLQAGLAQVQIFPVSEPGEPAGAALHTDYLYFTQLRAGSHMELYQMRRDGRALEAIPVAFGLAGPVAVDASAVYVASTASVERIDIVPLAPTH